MRDLFPDDVLCRADFAIELRSVASDRGSGGDKNDEKGPLFEVAISSETEIERWFGIEVLDHSRGAVDLTRLRNGAAVIVDHRGDQVGVVEPDSARVDDDRVLRARLRFSRSTRGSEIEQDVVDGIRRSVSVGYFIRDAKLVETRKVAGLPEPSTGHPAP